MHDAYEFSPIIQLNKVLIDSATAYGNSLIVGTKQGHLMTYSITKKADNKTYDVQLAGYSKHFSKKPIQQLSAIPHYNILVSLSDNVITVHDMSTSNFPLIQSITKTKGATLFTLDVKTHLSLTGSKSVTVRMCVAVKKKLLLFYWKNNEFLDLLLDEIILTDVPKALVWCEESICVGYKGDYSLVDLTKKDQKELFSTGKNPEPNIIKLNDTTVSMVRDSQSVFMDSTGNVMKHAVKWSEVPVALAYDEPYLIAALSDTIEVRSAQPLFHAQTIQLPKIQLIVPCSSGLFYVATSSAVWRFQSVPVTTQVKILLEEKQFQLALNLCKITEDTDQEKTKRIYQIQTLYAYDLFNNKQFHESMREFIKLKTDPYDVIRLFPSLLPQNTKDDGSNNDIQSSKLQNRDHEKSLLALIDYLTEVRMSLMKDVPKEGDFDVLSREQEHLLQIIDTTLLKCYLHTNDALIAPLLRLNHCHVSESEKILKKHRKFGELIILYQTKGLHNKALDLLEKQSEQQDSSLRGLDRTVQYLQHLGKEHIDLILQYSNWVLEKDADVGLKIFTEDLTEVEQLPRPKILDYLLKNQKSLVIPYLEHTIHVWNDDNPILHNSLIHQYREKVVYLCRNDASQTDKITGEHIRSKLLSFLEKSQYYTPETVLVHFPFDELFEERAIVLGKLGRHEQALSIYVTVLSNIEKAIEYCEKVYNENGESSSQVFAILLKLLINPPESWYGCFTPAVQPQPDLDMALKLLKDNASKISTSSAVKVLPDDVPIRNIGHYLVVSLMKQLTERRRTQVLKGLLYAEHLQIQEQRIHYESENSLLTEWNICSVCKKRFGNQSAFIRYPNGDIIHYSCQDQVR